jgi:hypothetical protein
MRGVIEMLPEYTGKASAMTRVEPSDAGGMALLISMIILTLLTLLGLYVAVNATTEVRISDNFESETRARYAALAGLDHVRSALRGLDFDDQLKGPDGEYDVTPSYLTQTRTFDFRNPLSWATARRLNLIDPSGEIGNPPDDGLLNSGHYGATPGTVLIPWTGVPSSLTESVGSGGTIASRYFVKLTDNNGEPSETSGDPSDDPFLDGDGLIIVRSMGVAAVVREWSGTTLRSNSVATFEARFKRRSTFDQSAALVVQGRGVQPSASGMFEGESFSILGDVDIPGIGTVETEPEGNGGAAGLIRSMLGPAQGDKIKGMGGSSSIYDVTGAIKSLPDRALLLDNEFLLDFVNLQMRRFSDSIFTGDQAWGASTAPDLGFYDLRQPAGASVQRPMTTLVDGDLDIGDAAGGGLLVVTGKLTISGNFTFKGLILLVGKGDLEARGSTCSITGGVFLAGISNSHGRSNWEPVRLTVGGSCEIHFDRRAIRMASSLIPPVQAGFREVTSATDP